jgi:hypothetical protein
MWVQEKYTGNMKTKKLKKISMMQSGGVRSRYDSKINRFTDAKKSLEEIKKAKRNSSRYMKKGGYMERMYQAGGMYADNTVASAGQGNVGNTANIVYQESNPQLQEQRLAAFETERANLSRQADLDVQEMKDQQEEDKLALEQKALEQQQKDQMVGGTISSGLEGAQSLGLIGDQKSAGSSVKDAVKAFNATKAANRAAQGYQAAKTTMAGIETAKNLKTGFDVARSSANVAQIGQQGLQAGNTLSQGFQLGKTATGLGGTATQFGGAATSLTGAGGAVGAAGSASALGSAASALNNVNVYAAAANYAGKGIKHLSDDDDATTWTAGEATGDTLSKAGEYAGYGAMLGSVVPGVGNAVGAAVGAVAGVGVGLYQGFAGRKKAREEEAKLEAKRKAFATKSNKKLRKKFGEQLIASRAGALKQKTYQGYDLGRNVVAQMGGMRMGTPRYGYAA